MSSYPNQRKARRYRSTVPMKHVRIDKRTVVEVPISMPDELARKRYRLNHMDTHQTRSDTLFKDEKIPPYDSLEESMESFQDKE